MTEVLLLVPFIALLVYIGTATSEGMKWGMKWRMRVLS